ncbi:hypothetical protein FJU31_11360 [Stenotrophomonas cyclobalanopsidis]|uniref:Uncharacterized protein n=1 Tax=Stenotrophomonas cyclobalanopsidis TaxID=2771362 RepID=A0ABQ6T0L6_9GAMM|nr:hypothetical protein [Stenotrophomonas cyclobalanopsidis]KAA8997893.1 hypothetical protein FJU31_11360 [Stenotrophomonas cyclobalanopsidis]
MKSRAYLTLDGNEYVTAQAVGNRRNKDYGGEPTGDRYFSTHRVGHRRPVTHVMKGSSWYFAYIDGQKGGAATDGESLQHLLFKEAFRRLTHVRLSLSVPSKKGPRPWCESKISITRVEQEWRVPGRGDYRADLYVEFASEDALGLKWEGNFLLEVRRSHAVDAAKQDGLRHLGIAVIEVDIGRVPIYCYPHPEDETSDLKEARYLDGIKRLLESERGFLQAIVLSNPSSKAFLELQLRKYQENLQILKKQSGQRQSELDEVTARCVGMEQGLSRMAAQLRQNEELLVGAQQAAVDLKKKLASQQGALQVAQDSVQSEVLDRRFYQICCWSLVVALLILVCWIVW